MISIYDPAAEVPSDVFEYDLRADVAQPGLRIGLVSNGFPDATNLLTAVGEGLKERLNDPVVQLIERFDPTVTADDEDLKAAQTCDVAVTALGQCGSCTTSAVRDAAAISKLGVPSVALVSYKFLDLAAFVADSVRMPDVPRAALPHPVAGTGIENVRRIAEGVVDEVIAALSGTRAPAAVGS
jgi:hypothetical protein